MKKLYLILLAVLFAGCSTLDFELSSDIIPSDSSNVVLFLWDHMYTPNRSEPENLVNYYLDDKEEIVSIFSEWKNLKKTSSFPSTGGSCQFDVYLFVDGKIHSCPIQGISENGRWITINGKDYKYDSAYWDALLPKLKRAKTEVTTYVTLHDYRTALSKIKGNKNFIYCESKSNQKIFPEEYDGSFYCAVDTRSTSKIQDKISKAYPNDKFDVGRIEHTGNGTGFVFMGVEWGSSDKEPIEACIYSSKEFYEKFNIYPKKEFEEFKDIKLTVYYK